MSTNRARAQAASLLAATMAMGLVTSVFVHWSVTIVPALRDTDDRTFVIAWQQLDTAILNPLFLGVGFVGALILTFVAGVLQAGAARRSARAWIAAAFALHLVAVVITIAVHEPLNVTIRTAGDPDQMADLAAVRAELQAPTWLAWNHVRAVADVIAFGCLGWALVAFGRATGAVSRSTIGEWAG